MWQRSTIKQTVASVGLLIADFPHVVQVREEIWILTLFATDLALIKQRARGTHLHTLSATRTRVGFAHGSCRSLMSKEFTPRPRSPSVRTFNFVAHRTQRVHRMQRL